ncbi:MAG TPA: sulfite exporter TauE/SafE family protein [Acidimicrobiales bacterium]
MDLSALDHGLAALAAVGAGAVNAVAGGGTLVTFPSLVALGVPSVQSNITNTVALCPGYVGGAAAQRDDLAGQRHRVRALGLAAAAGGLVGSILLVLSPEEVFEGIVPFLLFLACGLLAFQERLRHLLALHSAEDGAERGVHPMLLAGVFAATVYGGYFGAGLGIIVIAALGLTLDEEMPRLNALKQLISLVANVVAASFFLFSGEVAWSLALVMAPAALLGGALGGRLASRLHARATRAVVVVIGLVVACVYLAT